MSNKKIYYGVICTACGGVYHWQVKLPNMYFLPLFGCPYCDASTDKSVEFCVRSKQNKDGSPNKVSLRSALRRAKVI